MGKIDISRTSIPITWIRLCKSTPGLYSGYNARCEPHRLTVLDGGTRVIYEDVIIYPRKGFRGDRIHDAK
jgi:hypothetical protein